MERVESLCEALDQIGLAVQSGRFGDLAGLAQRAEAEAAQLRDPSRTALEAIRRKAGTNALCLAAALRGVRAARRRIAEITDMQNGMVTYDCNGRRDETARQPGRLAERF